METIVDNLKNFTYITTKTILFMEGYKYDRSKSLNNPFDEKLMKISESMSFALPKYKAYNFVGGAQITSYAKLKQWLLELRGREDAVEHLEYTVRKAELEIQMDEESKEFITDPKRREMVDLTIADKLIDLRKFKRNLKDAYRERQGFIELIKEFLETDDAILPDGTKLIDVFGNPELEEKYEHEYWTVRMAKQAMLDMISYGRIGTGNLDSILMMDPEQQKQVLSLASSYTISIDRNINQLMSQATTNHFSIEESLKNQLKLDKPNNIQTEKLL
jgi:predicted house-cleaning noncanonical NTP pyrophosphatase (MazG superfamily)